ncbi:S-adenosyl-L-homocysteine hydrolase [Tanacetum coccineum]
MSVTGCSPTDSDPEQGKRWLILVLKIRTNPEIDKTSNNKVAVEFQNNQPGKPKVSFEGSSEDYKANDAALFFDGESFRLQRLHRWMICVKGHAEVPNPAFVNEKIRSIEANHLTVGVVLNLAISEISNHMIAETSIRSGNPPEQLVPNTKRKCDTVSGNSATIIYTPDEHLYRQNRQYSNIGFDNVENDVIQGCHVNGLEHHASSEIVVEVPNVEDIGGHENVKQVLHEDFPEPFFLKNREGETFAEVKVRIQKKLQIPSNKFSMEYWWCTKRALNTLGGGPHWIVDDGGDATLLIHEGVKAEEEFVKTRKVSYPSSTDNAEFHIVLSIIKEGFLSTL